MNMRGHVLKVCIFCFLCASHFPCSPHAAVTHDAQNLLLSQELSSGEKFKEKNRIPPPPLISPSSTTLPNSNNEDLINNNHKDVVVEEEKEEEHSVVKRQNDIIKSTSLKDKEFFISKIFTQYGNGETITMEGFEKLLNRLVELKVVAKHLDQIVDHDHDHHHHNHNHEHDDNSNNNDTDIESLSLHQSCLQESDFESIFPLHYHNKKDNLTVTSKTIEDVCPALLYSILSGNCTFESPNFDNNNTNSYVLTWIYSIVAVIVISACGIFALGIIPLMQKKFYKPLLQFLVALAVGTLAGDALLHLLPHAMVTSCGGHSHNYIHNHDHGHDHENMWKGFVAMLGLVLFFIVERFIPIISKWKKAKCGTGRSHVTVLNSGVDHDKLGGTKCVDKYNAYDRCYTDILNDPTTMFINTNEAPSKNSTKKVVSEAVALREEERERGRALNCHYDESFPKISEDLKNNDASNKEITCLSPLSGSREEDDTDYTVILTQHGASHHGHSHTHGHVHAAPQNFSSVAWMVIMGDGLHNFTDGMAIGAAFSNSIAGGFSTSVAVFCHELPHELGDFAMLLKAGMSIKEAFCYNLLSSVLCLLGNIFGLWLGNTEYATSWVFAVAAGTFIYIALVDMIPELSSSHEDEGNLMQCILHLGGLILGFGIMTLIALFEHDLKNIFH